VGGHPTRSGVNNQRVSNHLEKYESQWDGLSHILWNKKMFQTTNQMKNGDFIDINKRI
jgi:hypothetical protein